ncbi:MAG: hypothetical protein PHT34_04180 [Oscillospiraceae bacterium]|nr:hypothetical protein [Oscillospiraceae bacterium]
MEKKKMTIFAVLIAILIVAALLASFGLTLLSGGTPAVTLPGLSKKDAAGTDAPSDEASEGNYIRVDVTPKTVQSVIATLARAESYYRVVTIDTLAGSKMEEASISCWVTKGYSAARMQARGKVRHSITGNGTLYIWYDGDRTWYEGPLGALSADIVQRIPTYEDVLKIDQKNITDAGYQMLKGVSCIYVEVADRDLGYAERYWISVDSGLLICAETRKENKIVWRMISYDVEIPMPADAPFVLPDGTDVRAAAPGT